MSRWDISADAADLHADALVWDMTLPILTPGRPERKVDLFARFARSGFDFATITLAIDPMDFGAAARQIAEHRRFVRERSETCVLAESVEEVLRAREAGKRSRPRRLPLRRSRRSRRQPGRARLFPYRISRTASWT